MKVGSIVKFNDERFFEGAVQLSWLEKRREQAQLAAKSFVFHGPRYHGASQAAADGIDSNYRLKDTASFINDLLTSMLQSSQGNETNPYWLVVAGYGSGKSHLALTCSMLLSEPESDTSKAVLQQLKYADADLGENILNQVVELRKPALVLPLDGMSGFHLGNALSQAVFKQLRLLGIDSDPIRNLSPRFKTAEQFVERNYSVRRESFERDLPGLDITQLCQRLSDNDEQVYEIVDSIYTEANGQSIPIEGQESAQELIETLCNVYCGVDGPFSQVIIMFDEFGRYLEYAADKPHLAGDAALQQIFQGIQDNSDKVRFIGFIQYELKTYLKRFSGTGLRQLQRYITRFDAAEKWYLSTNLETIFAHMIQKEERELDKAWQQLDVNHHYMQTHARLASCLPGFARFPVWQDQARFSEVICRGCWPLHPLAVWFLTRQKDVVQSRSALTFIKDTITRIADVDIIQANQLKRVSAAELVLRSMLSELVAAEREVGGTVAETLQTLLEKFSGHLSDEQQLLLAGVTALEKMRVGKQSQETADALLCEATALDEACITKTVSVLSELGALEWNRDLGRYELLTDGASRGQFQQWVRKLLRDFDPKEGRDLFMRRAAMETSLTSIETDFAQANLISTPDWKFEASLAHSGNLATNIKLAFKEWSEGRLPTEAKGRVIYLYLGEDDDRAAIDDQILECFSEELKRYNINKAPVWVIGLDDQQSVLLEHFFKLYLFEEQVSSADRERFRRFIPDEQQRCQIGLKGAIDTALKQRLFWVAGFELAPKGRMKIAGKEIFSSIYTQPIPFPFDGFATKNGSAKADCAQLMRGLIARQVDGSWVQTQRKTLHNRVDSLMAKSWGTLLPSGKLVAPREKVSNSVYNTLVKAHQDDPTRSLLTSYHQLIRPPFGMNAASAGLMISMLLALDIPPRRLEYAGELVASSDWITLVFKGKANELQESVLETTKLRFLSENSESRWRELLARWETALAYDEKIKFAIEADRLHKVDPIPESLEGLYRYLSDDSEKARCELVLKKDQLSRLELSLEKAERKNSVEHALATAKKLKQLHEELENSGLWPEALINDCEALLKVSHTLFAGKLDEWIKKQVCHSMANLADFRNRLEANVRALNMLGYEKQAIALQTQAVSSINRVEKLQKYSLTLAECEDYPRQPAPTATTSVRELRDEVARGDQLIETLKGASDTLNPSEIEALIHAITIRQNSLRKADVERRNALGELYNAPESEQGLTEMLKQAQQLQKVFVGTRDEQEISEIIYQLDFILNDIKSWPMADISATQLEEFLETQSTNQAQTFQARLEEKDIEPAWCENVYRIITGERIEKAKHRSQEWTNIRLKLATQVDKLECQRCLVLQQELDNAPTYLSDSDRQSIESLLSSVIARIRLLEEQKRRENNQEWLKQFTELESMESLSRHETENLLKRLKRPPHELNECESATIRPVEQALHAHLDQMSIDDILLRVSKLSRVTQLDIIKIIEGNLLSSEV